MSNHRTRESFAQPGPAHMGSAGGTCAIAHVRGDVTTVRAAATILARRQSSAMPERDPVTPDVTSDPSLAHLLGVGPA